MRADRGFLRTLRAGVFAGAAVGLGAAAHEAGGGTVTPAAALSGFLAVLLVARALAGRSRRLPGVLAATALAQGALHLLFGAWSTGTCHSITHGGAHGGHAMVMQCSGGAPMTHAGGWAMTLGHALAALLLVALLTHGERALWALLALLGLRPPAPAITVRFARATLRVVARWAVTVRALVTAISLRGPPVTVSS